MSDLAVHELNGNSLLTPGKGRKLSAAQKMREVRESLLDAAPEAIETLRELLHDQNPNARARASLGMLDFTIGKVSSVKLPDQAFVDLVMLAVTRSAFGWAEIHPGFDSDAFVQHMTASLNALISETKAPSAHSAQGDAIDVKDES